ncbi:ParA family protein [Pseudonocardia sp. HH130630-07]|uniref:ParA family protein n=1 Tax=Pseudonocardia sp. HH130630-07 TaxID=1690815 RepID=UPI0018D3E2C5|nr:ParA family protein [Pseudonocardia sp. HH130630-07]
MTAASTRSAWEALERQQQGGPVQLRWPEDLGTVVLAIDSEKGGVGKSSLAGGLVAVMAAAGHDVLAVDLDPRATLTAELDAATPEGDAGLPGVNDLLYEDQNIDPGELPELRGLAEQAVRPAGPQWGEQVQVLAAERALAHRESDLTTPNLEHRLALSLEGFKKRFRLVVIDLPPRAGGKLVGAGLLAATHVLFPGTLDEDGLIGVQDARKTAQRIARAHPATLRPVGVLRNIIEPRTRLAELSDQRFVDGFDDVLDVVVPKRIVRREARTACVPITTATTRDAQDLTNAYTLVLNAIAEVR